MTIISQLLHKILPTKQLWILVVAFAFASEWQHHCIENQYHFINDLQKTEINKRYPLLANINSHTDFIFFFFLCNRIKCSSKLKVNSIVHIIIVLKCIVDLQFCYFQIDIELGDSQMFNGKIIYLFISPPKSKQDAYRIWTFIEPSPSTEIIELK